MIYDFKVGTLVYARGPIIFHRINSTHRIERGEIGIIIGSSTDMHMGINADVWFSRHQRMFPIYPGNLDQV